MVFVLNIGVHPGYNNFTKLTEKCVNWMMWRVLREIGVPEQLIALIRQPYGQDQNREQAYNEEGMEKSLLRVKRLQI